MLRSPKDNGMRLYLPCFSVQLSRIFRCHVVRVIHHNSHIQALKCLGLPLVFP